MTLPFERARALQKARQLLTDLINPASTPRVPRAIRKRAYDALKHFSIEQTPSLLPPNEHGYCPVCEANYDGKDIVETYLDMGYLHSEALSHAENFGYRPGRTKFGRQIMIEDPLLDRCTRIKCPDCGHTYLR